MPLIFGAVVRGWGKDTAVSISLRLALPCHTPKLCHSVVDLAVSMNFMPLSGGVLTIGALLFGVNIVFLGTPHLWMPPSLLEIVAASKNLSALWLPTFVMVRTPAIGASILTHVMVPYSSLFAIWDHDIRKQ